MEGNTDKFKNIKRENIFIYLFIYLAWQNNPCTYWKKEGTNSSIETKEMDKTHKGNKFYSVTLKC